MQDGARFFAYATWALMVSLAIIIFTHSFLDMVNRPGWLGTIVLLAFGFIYLNLTYAAVKRFIRKVPAPTKAHLLLAFLIYLPPFIWIYASADIILTTEILLFTILAIACGMGAWHGNKAGIKARYEYIQSLKEKHDASVSSNNGNSESEVQ